MKLALWIGLAVVVSLVAPLLLLFSFTGEVKTQTTLTSTTGTLRFIPGYRGGSPYIEVSSAQGTYRFVCPRNIRTFPCNEPQDAFRLTTNRLGTVSYYKYDLAPIDAGRGVVQSLHIGTLEFKFQ